MTAIAEKPGKVGQCAKHGEFEREYVERLGWYGTCRECELERQRAYVEAQHRDRVEDLYQRAFLPRRFNGARFSNYEPQTDMQRAALKACTDYVENIEANIAGGVCLTLLGPPGVGKSHLLTATAHAILHAERLARYTTAADFLAAIRGNWAWHSAEFGEHFTAPPVLMFDEVWLPVHDRDREALVALVDARYRVQYPTLTASNLTWPQMKEALGERLCDRLLENGGKVLALDGASMRTKL